MIILDEQLHEAGLKERIADWCGESTHTVKDLKCAGYSDESLIHVLMKHKNCIFVTINWPDFWRRREISLHPGFTIIGFNLDSEDTYKIPAMLPEVLKLPQFKIRRRRGGFAFRIAIDEQSHQGTDRQFHQTRMKVEYYTYQNRIPVALSPLPIDDARYALCRSLEGDRKLRMQAKKT